MVSKLKFLNFKGNLGIFMKFTIAFIVVGLIPLMVLSFISLSTLTKQVEQHTINSYEEMLEYSTNRIQNFYEDYNHISKLMYWYNLPEFGRVNELIEKEGKLESYRTELAIDDFLRTILNTDKHIESVFFIPAFDERTRFHNRKNKRFISSNFKLYQDNKHRFAENINHLKVFPTHKDPYFNDSNQYVLTFARNLLTTDKLVSKNSRILGTLLLDVNVRAIESIFSDLELKPEDEIYVLTDDGYCIYSNQNQYIAKEFTIDHDFYSDENMVFENDIEDLGWKIIAKIEKQSILDSLLQTRTTIQTVIFISIIALVFVAILFSRQFSQPIYKMTQLMKEVESGNLNLKMDINRNDEIGLLANGFDRMVKNLKAYIKKVYVAEIGQKQAQLDALRSQINPHYLYNTLEVIRMTAVQHNNLKTADMIHYLSFQLKYVMKQNEDLITLEQEINHVKSYLELIKVRYEEKINYEIQWSENVAKCIVPKLSIQPIVENAVIHGLKSKLGKGNILVKCKINSDENLSITVIDDGVGMSKEELKNLRDSIYSLDGKTNKNGIGLRNVHDRISQLYGKPFGLEVTSKRNLGTIVSLVVPLKGEVDD